MDARLEDSTCGSTDLRKQTDVRLPVFTQPWDGMLSCITFHRSTRLPDAFPPVPGAEGTGAPDICLRVQSRSGSASALDGRAQHATGCVPGACAMARIAAIKADPVP